MSAADRHNSSKAVPGAQVPQVSLSGVHCVMLGGGSPRQLMFRTSFPGKQEQDPPSGKKDYVPPLGLHPVPRGGNWVHPKNNQRCKQPQSANVFHICGPDHLKVQLFSHCHSMLVPPRAESNPEVTWAL